VLGGEATLGDSYTIAKVLAVALKDQEYDLILVGVQGVGTDNAQVGQMLAEILNVPHVSGITSLDIDGGTLTAGREVEGGKEVVSSPLPALLTCHKGLNEPRYAALKGIMAAKRKPVEKIEVGTLGIDENAGGAYSVRSLELPPEKGEFWFVSNSEILKFVRLHCRHCPRQRGLRAVISRLPRF